MRVAVITLKMDARSRSTNVARALAMIDAAARLDPAPDVIALPAGCDRIVGQNGAPAAEALAETFVASLAYKAIEWGVFVAAAVRHGEGPMQTVLLDPDGDALTPAIGGPIPNGGRRYDTPIGSLAMVVAGAESSLEQIRCSSSVDLLLLFRTQTTTVSHGESARSGETRETEPCACIVPAAGRSPQALSLAPEAGVLEFEPGPFGAIHRFSASGRHSTGLAASERAHCDGAENTPQQSNEKGQVTE